MDFTLRELIILIPFITTLIGWFIRLESKVFYNSKEDERIDKALSEAKAELKTVENSVDQLRIKIEIDVDKMRENSDKKIDNLSSSLSEVRIILARIEERLTNKINP